MSYEGRSIYICSKGHITTLDCYDDWDDSQTNQKFHCSVCQKPVTRVGGVDDTNGEAVASFYKKIIRPERTEKKYNPETDTLTIVRYPGVYEIVRGKPGEWFNFDTGEQYPSDDDDED